MLPNMLSFPGFPGQLCPGGGGVERRGGGDAARGQRGGPAA